MNCVVRRWCWVEKPFWVWKKLFKFLRRRLWEIVKLCGWLKSWRFFYMIHHTFISNIFIFEEIHHTNFFCNMWERIHWWIENTTIFLLFVKIKWNAIHFLFCICTQLLIKSENNHQEFQTFRLIILLMSYELDMWHIFSTFH